MALDRQIRSHGYEAWSGQVIDATLVPASKQHFTRKEKTILEEGAMLGDWKPAKRRQKDLDASWTKKHGKSYHGYKMTVSVDRKHKFVRRWVHNTAKVHDSVDLKAALDEWNTSREIHAERGYVHVEREDRLREQGYRPQIQRRATAAQIWA